MACSSALLLIKWDVAASLLQSRKQLWWLCSLAVEMQRCHFLGEEEKTKQALLRRLQLSPMQEGSCQVTAVSHSVVTVMSLSEWLVFLLGSADAMWLALATFGRQDLESSYSVFLKKERLIGWMGFE